MCRVWLFSGQPLPGPEQPPGPACQPGAPSGRSLPRLIGLLLLVQLLELALVEAEQDVGVVLAGFGPEIAQVGPQRLDRNGVAAPQSPKALGAGAGLDDLAQGLAVVCGALMEGDHLVGLCADRFAVLAGVNCAATPVLCPGRQAGGAHGRALRPCQTVQAPQSRAPVLAHPPWTPSSPGSWFLPGPTAASSGKRR